MHGHHLRHDYDYDTQIAEVTGHPVRDDLFGLCNRTEVAWTATLPDGETRTVVPTKSIRIAPGTEIDFGAGLTTGRIESLF